VFLNKFLYFYSGFEDFEDSWAKVFAERSIVQKNSVINIKIIGYSHFITSIEINLQQLQNLSFDNFNLQIIPYSNTTVKNFLKPKNKLYYFFDKNSLTAIIWELKENQICIKTLHTYLEFNVNVITSSMYKI